MSTARSLRPEIADIVRLLAAQAVADYLRELEAAEPHNIGTQVIEQTNGETNRVPDSKLKEVQP